MDVSCRNVRVESSNWRRGCWQVKRFGGFLVASTTSESLILGLRSSRIRATASGRVRGEHQDRQDLPERSDSGIQLGIDGTLRTWTTRRRHGWSVGSGGLAFVTMVQSTDLRQLHNRPNSGELNCSRLWGILVQRHVSSRMRVVKKIRLQDATQRHFVEDDAVVRALSAD